MGLLAVVMPPVHAAAILILPSLVTNVWQMLAGPALSVVLRRLWPMMLAVCLGTWAGLGLMTAASARFGTALLGIALALYAITGLATLRLFVPKQWEPIFSPIVGAITGLITAATGLFVIPAVPYLQAIGLRRDEPVQALDFRSLSRPSRLPSMWRSKGNFGSPSPATRSRVWHSPARECGSGRQSACECRRRRPQMVLYGFDGAWTLSIWLYDPSYDDRVGRSTGRVACQ
jgi:hypothetical protein